MFHSSKKRKVSYVILLMIITLSIFSLTTGKISLTGLSIDPYSYLVESSITKLKISMVNFIIGADRVKSIKQKPSKESELIKELEWKNSLYKKKLNGIAKLFPMKLNYRFTFYKFVGSQIIARDINYNGKFWINLGTSNHVVSGTPIITNNLELIGTVKNSYPSKSSVWSILTKGSVIDAVDSVKIKSAMIAYCKRNKLPIITIGGAGGQTDPSKIEICDLSKTYQDPLLAKVKNQLRREYNFPRADIKKANKRKFSIAAVYSTEQLSYPTNDGDVCHAKQTANGAMRLDCSGGFGATTHVTASFAFFAVAHSIKKYLAKNIS